MVLHEKQITGREKSDIKHVDCRSSCCHVTHWMETFRRGVLTVLLLVGARPRGVWRAWCCGTAWKGGSWALCLGMVIGSPGNNGKEVDHHHLLFHFGFLNLPECEGAGSILPWASVPPVLSRQLPCFRCVPAVFFFLFWYKDETSKRLHYHVELIHLSVISNCSIDFLQRAFLRGKKIGSGWRGGWPFLSLSLSYSGFGVCVCEGGGEHFPAISEAVCCGPPLPPALCFSGPFSSLLCVSCPPALYQPWIFFSLCLSSTPRSYSFTWAASS